MKRILLCVAVAAGLGGVGVSCAPRAASTPVEESEPREAAEPPTRPAFAEDRVPVGADAKPAPFDGKRSMQYLRHICALGPRISGSETMKKQQEILHKHFEQLGAKIQVQKFTVTQNTQRQPVEMANLVVSFFPERTRRVILCSHYDTRPIADEERDPRRWTEPFVSANDGGSGVAFLMELGHHLKELKLHVGVDFVFFDGEEYIFDRKRDRYFFGSQHFAQTWAKSKSRPNYVAAVLLDMIAGKNAKFPAEGYSAQRHPELVNSIWNVAAELRVPNFIREVDRYVEDDHLALQTVGIEAIDLIDFSYPHWHRLSDTPDNCSAESLEAVSKVLSVWLQRVQ